MAVTTGPIARAIRRTADDYTQAVARHLPRGRAWRKSPDSVLMKTVQGLATIWADIDGRAADLLEVETDPRQTVEMLADWQRNFGLPDPCVAESIALPDQQNAIVTKMTSLGGQSRAYFVGVAASLGYTITIQEYAPYQCGISRCGTVLDSDGNPAWYVGPPELRYLWKVKLVNNRLTWFRTGLGGGEVGVDHLLTIALATDLECIIRRWKPAQTEVIFDYSAL